jgi:GR25 family glycosyltransferase involved in LPS biosynthesis
MKSTLILKYINQNLEYIIFFALLIILVLAITKRNWEGFFTEQHGINALDAIIYINLENRQDRKDLLLKELEQLNANTAKIHKVSGVYIPKNGHKGCIQSHILALNMIKLNKWNRVLILEDDAQLDTNPEVVNDIITQSIKVLDEKDPKWNVIMLATANKVINTKASEPHSSQLEIYAPDGKLKPIALERLTRATTSSAYVVKGDYVDEILGLFNTCNDNMKSTQLSGNKYEYWALDQKWATLQERDHWYALSPDPIKQREIWSTILTESHQ